MADSAQAGDESLDEPMSDPSPQMADAARGGEESVSDPSPQMPPVTKGIRVGLEMNRDHALAQENRRKANKKKNTNRIFTDVFSYASLVFLRSS